VTGPVFAGEVWLGGASVSNKVAGSRYTWAFLAGALVSSRKTCPLTVDKGTAFRLRSGALGSFACAGAPIVTEHKERARTRQDLDFIRALEWPEVYTLAFQTSILASRAVLRKTVGRWMARCCWRGGSVWMFCNKERVRAVECRVTEGAGWESLFRSGRRG